MLIEIPDDLARRIKEGLTLGAATYRRVAQQNIESGHYEDAAMALALAVIAEADLPEPVQVGHLARVTHTDTRDVLVLAIDGEWAWVHSRQHGRYTEYLDALTYAGPKPEGWGEQ